MNKLLPPVAALGLTVGLLGGCAEPEIRQPAAVYGYFNGLDSTIVTDDWVSYEGQASIPRDDVRNTRSYEVQDGCSEAYDWSGIMSDDFDCFGEWCFSGEDTYCKPDYVTYYDYEHLEEVVVRDCPAEVVISEYKKPEPAEDLACQSFRRDGERNNKISRFMIWLRTKNPNFNKEKGSGEREFLQQPVVISRETWQSIDHNTEVTAVIQDGHIIDVELNFASS